jgi:hypothetical protein
MVIFFRAGDLTGSQTFYALECLVFSLTVFFRMMGKGRRRTPKRNHA